MEKDHLSIKKNSVHLFQQLLSPVLLQLICTGELPELYTFLSFLAPEKMQG